MCFGNSLLRLSFIQKLFLALSDWPSSGQAWDRSANALLGSMRNGIEKAERLIPSLIRISWNHGWKFRREADLELRARSKAVCRQPGPSHLNSDHDHIQTLEFKLPGQDIHSECLDPADSYRHPCFALHNFPMYRVFLGNALGMGRVDDEESVVRASKQNVHHGSNKQNFPK